MDTPAGGRNVKPRITRVPSLRPRKLTWKLSQFGNGVDIDIAEFESLQQLTFGYMFDQPINEVVWPASLEELTFGDSFNQPINEVVWPASLQQLTFEYGFNQPIHEAVSYTHLTLPTIA